MKEFAGLTVDILTPGAMVSARVRAVQKDGILLSFLTYFTGTVSLSNTLTLPFLSLFLLPSLCG